MFTTAISEDVQKNLALLGRCPWLSSFYLAGGTALALHLGHHFSLDLYLLQLSYFQADSEEPHAAERDSPSSSFL
jgi:hypothetical protein